MHGFGRMLSYEQYPEEKSRLWLSSFEKKLINLHEGLLDVTTNISSNRVHPKMFDSYRDSLLTTLLTSEKKIVFLDTEVYGPRFTDGKILDVSTYYKPTETFQYTHLSSRHLL